MKLNPNFKISLKVEHTLNLTKYHSTYPFQSIFHRNRFYFSELNNLKKLLPKGKLKTTLFEECIKSRMDKKVFTSIKFYNSQTIAEI